jgi:SAM-dependent methyltransferase
MFENSAKWYDALYSFKDYQQESEAIVSLLRREHPKANSILDIACGTAEHDKYLSKKYSVDGIDINSEFIEVASKKNPDGEYFCADMTDFDLSRTYDIILCLFSSIGYVKTIDNVIKTLRCFKRHLNDDGIIVIEPWFVPAAWNPDDRVYILTGETPEGKICRMNISEQKDSLSILHFHYLIGTVNGVEHFTELHELGLFSVEEIKEAFKFAELSVKYDKEGLTGRGLYIAGHYG